MYSKYKVLTINNTNYMKYCLYIPIILGLLSCQTSKSKVEQESTLDSTLQINATSILKEKLLEVGGQSGQVIIMETKTGQIKALVGFERKDSANYQPNNNLGKADATTLFSTMAIMMALETGKVNLLDTVDVGNGIYITDSSDSIKDGNWQRGGYGAITVEEGIMVNSQVSTILSAEKAFGKGKGFSYETFNALLDKISVCKPDSIEGIEIKQSCKSNRNDKNCMTSSYQCQLTNSHEASPIHTLTFYNAIANDGKMIKPLLHKNSVEIINPQIASKETINSIQQALYRTVEEGLAKPAKSQHCKAAGQTGSTNLHRQNSKANYVAEFCGYFPADAPKYTVIVVIHKNELPVSGGLMAGDVFRKIVDSMI